MLSLNAPAKINWILKVLGRRADGYHDIQSLIQKVTLYDELTFSPSRNISLKTDAPVSVEENLVYRAAVLLKEAYNLKSGASIVLKKKIPIGAGLGGGSSDAATALIALNELWSLGLTREELAQYGEKLGSDVPFFLFDSMSYVSGRGEKISARQALKSLNILLINPAFKVSTAWVYENFSALNSSLPVSDPGELTKKAKKVNNIEHFIRKIERAELLEMTDSLSNDLESVTIKSFPVVAEIKEKLISQGAVVSLMSGSGPTVFGVFESHEKAKEASKYFSGCWTAVVQTIN